MVNKIVVKNGVVFAKKITLDNIKEGISFYSNDEDFIQVGTWSYNKGRSLAAHNHNIVDRTINRTNEIVIVLSGKLKIDIYDESDNKIDEMTAEKNDLLIMMNGGHGYHILKDNTKVIEIKNGPYLGAEKDRRRLW